jgi:hypothetical protein
MAKDQVNQQYEKLLVEFYLIFIVLFLLHAAKSVNFVYEFESCRVI